MTSPSDLHNPPSQAPASQVAPAPSESSALMPDRLSSATDHALAIPEIVLLVQEHLSRPSLLVSLRVCRQWHQVGRHLVWQLVHWENTLEDTVLTRMANHAHRIRTLHCTFHSQRGTSHVDSSSLLRALLPQEEETLARDQDDLKLASSLPAPARLASVSTITQARATTTTATSASPNTRWGSSLSSFQQQDLSSTVHRTRLQRLYLKGHFDLLQRSDVVPNVFVALTLPSLTRLEISPAVNSSVDIHLILDSAPRLQHLVIRSHGSYISSRHHPTELQEDIPVVNGLYHPLKTLKIQYLKISQEELQYVAAQCPHLIHFQSLSSPGTLWRQHPTPSPIVLAPQDQQQHIQLQQQEPPPLVPPPKTAVGTLAQSWRGIQRFHVGLQQGGFHVDSIRETLTSFPQLDSLGLPAWDCTKVTMETLKTVQLESRMNPSRPGGTFLTSLHLLNVSASEKVSQTIHDYLCWTPYLKELYAYNTTLYLEQMQPGSVSVEPQQEPQALQHAPLLSPLSPNQLVHEVWTRQDQGNGSQHVDDTLNRAVPSVATTEAPQQQRLCQWACTGLETLVVRFARAPWRSLSDPPKRSQDTFAFMGRLQRLKRLCIKEGLMLEAGREYDALKDLGGLEELVFTTCYPIPLKVTDMDWLKEKDLGNAGGCPQGKLKRVVIRRQKTSAQDKEMVAWFGEHRPRVRFSFEQTDCSEDEYSFDANDSW